MKRIIISVLVVIALMVPFLPGQELSGKKRSRGNLI